MCNESENVKIEIATYKEAQIEGNTKLVTNF